MPVKYNSTITQKRLKELLNYNLETGIFTWVVGGAGRRVGYAIGGISDSGYIRARIDGVSYYVHRLVFLWMNGEHPTDEVDHKNGNRTDNRWSNLRQVTRGENRQNLAFRKDNASGYMGVHFRGFINKYQARIAVNGSRCSLGHFDTAEEASAAYLKAKQDLHPAQPIPRHIKDG